MAVLKSPVCLATPPVQGDKQQSDEGGLLGLILDTDEKDLERRKEEKLRSELRNRRMYSSSPSQRNRKELDDVLRQQPPRQATAEASATIRIVRSKTLPTPDSNERPTKAKFRQDKRTSTPQTAFKRTEDVTHLSSSMAKYGANAKEMPPASGTRSASAESAPPATIGTATPSAGLTLSPSPSRFNRAAGSSFTAARNPVVVGTPGASKAAARAAVPRYGPKVSRDGANKAATTPRVANAQPSFDAAKLPHMSPALEMWRSSPGRMHGSSSGDGPQTGSSPGEGGTPKGRMRSFSPGGVAVNSSPGGDPRVSAPSPVTGYSPIRGGGRSGGRGIDNSAMTRKTGKAAQGIASPATRRQRRRGSEMNAVRFEGIDSSSSDER